MKIQCKKCGYAEPTNLSLFVKIIGGAAPIGGFWAWTAYLFAGTGFALPIVAAIISGGVGMLLFKDQIVVWITNKGYKCPRCNASNWGALAATATAGGVVATPPSQPVTPQRRIEESRPSSTGTLNLLIVVGGLIWLAYILTGASRQTPSALPAQTAQTQAPVLRKDPLPNPTHRAARKSSSTPRRKATSDLRNCLSLKTNEAIAKCAERSQ